MIITNPTVLRWEVWACPNPKKGWLVCNNKKLTRLSAINPLVKLAEEHNRAIEYLQAKITEMGWELSPDRMGK